MPSNLSLSIELTNFQNPLKDRLNELRRQHPIALNSSFEDDGLEVKDDDGDNDSYLSEEISDNERFCSKILLSSLKRKNSDRILKRKLSKPVYDPDGGGDIKRRLPKMDNDEVVIIGAGISGLATPIALHKKGIKCIVMERSVTISNTTGSAILIWLNGWRALEQLAVANTLRHTATHVQRFIKLIPYIEAKLSFCEGCEKFLPER